MKTLFTLLITTAGIVQSADAGEIVASRAALELKASRGCTVTDSVLITVAGISGDADIRISGEHAHLFSIEPDMLDMCEAQSGGRIDVGYRSEETGVHTATLHIQTDEDEKTIDITGRTYLLYENFNRISLPLGQANIDLSGNLLEEYLSSSSGWTYQSLHTYHTGGGFGGVILEQSANGSQAYLSTPPLDLSTPVTLSFMSRKVGDNAPPVYVKAGDRPVFSVDALTNTITPRSTAPFTAGSSDVISFYSAGASRVVIDEVLADYYTGDHSGTRPESKEADCTLSVQGKTLHIQATLPQTVYIYNSLGQAVTTEEMQSSRIALHLSDPGLYIVKMGGNVWKINL
ncbi:MAG: hypothetical protein LBK22_04885 [Tannerella sp.]|jgi:hypothetical protein|nr:hypothetical protein [Tannerella sp.]